MSTAIRIENLSKRYRVQRAEPQAEYRTLRDDLARLATAPLGWLNGRRGQTRPSAFWALKDVSLEVQRGEVVGIIGPNGAGKSTLLKIVSRITRPTAGTVRIRGRVGSLLEVGTGFHSELSGRENIYLNGAVLGMRRREIARKFDEIVAFAEIGEFLNTPVKRYSSGMYVRLAFAVAAHLETEILLVDEVLAVGDATYQRRCIQRMSELAAGGRTVLFVSHNMEMIPRLCQTAALLERGRIESAGPASEVCGLYLAQQSGPGEGEDISGRSRTGDGRARFTRLALLDAAGQICHTHRSGDDLTLRIEIAAGQAIEDAALAVVLRTLSGTRLITSWTREVGFACRLRPGVQCFACRFERVHLRPGHRIAVMLWMEASGVIDSLDPARLIDITAGPETAHMSAESAQGIVVCNYHWAEVEPSPERAEE